VPVFRLVYRPGLTVAAEEVEADVAVVEQRHVVLRRTAFVMGRPRDVVARRVLTEDLLSWDPLEG
jgi:hypothetical protein